LQQLTADRSYDVEAQSTGKMLQWRDAEGRSSQMPARFFAARILVLL
jgi:hypothetical protein